eukprot:12948334-Ditylum_brightwellii.AAC.1
MSIEILNVKQHGSEMGWSNKPRRENNELWEEGTVCKIQGVQKQTTEKLARAGITLVKSLKYWDDNNKKNDVMHLKDVLLTSLIIGRQTILIKMVINGLKNKGVNTYEI